MKRVYNHVIWKASNHPTRFKKHDVSDSHDYMKKICETISRVDSSRFISSTSFWEYSHMEITMDPWIIKAIHIEPNPILMEKLMTRGSQDTYTGYGAKWSSLRNAPNKGAASCLEADNKPCFNFEHEESAAQSMGISEKWYKVQSYEWAN